MEYRQTIAWTIEWWWCLVLLYLLIIGCVELNPGPRKRKTISYKASKAKKRDYMKNYRASQLEQSEVISPSETSVDIQMNSSYSNYVHTDKSGINTCSAISQDRKTPQERKSRSREKKEVREKERQSDFSRKRMLRSQSDYRDTENEQQKMNKRKVRSQSEFKEKENELDIVRKRKCRSQSVFRDKENEQQKMSKQKVRSQPELKEKENEVDIIRKRKCRSQSVFKDKENEQQKMSKRKVRSKPEFKEKENEVDIVRKRKCRSQSVFRDQENEQKKIHKRNVRSKPEFKEKENEVDIVRKRKCRSQSVFRDNENEQKKIHKRNVRSQSEFKEKENAVDIVRKRKCRSQSVFRDKENEQKKIHKRNVRSQSSFRDKEKEKEKIGKRKHRSDSSYRDAENIKQKQLKQSLRSDEFTKGSDDARNLKSKKLLRNDPYYQEMERVRNTESRRRKRIAVSVNKLPKNKKQQTCNIRAIAEKFRKIITDGPVYVCSSCKRTLYRHSVLVVPKHRYKNRKEGSMEHILTDSKTYDGKEYICRTCHNALMKNKIPVQSQYNHLQLDDIPVELSCITQLESRLVSKRLPFMQICNLPKGGQKGIQGPVINVPSDIDTIQNALPRLPTETGLIPIKLKRKLKYKGHTMYQCIKPSNIKKALQCLIENNPLYADVKVNDDWVQEAFKIDKELSDQLFAPFSENNDEVNQEELPPSSSDSEPDSDQDEDEKKERLKGLPFNSCLQPADMLPKKNISADDIICVAPGENQHPISMLTDTSCDVLAFPVEFPKGRFGLFDADRPVKITPKKHFNQRVLNVDKRCARNIDYLFFSQYYTEMKQVIDSINIAMRKGTNAQSGQRLNAGMVTGENMSELLQQNDGYRFIQNIRGSYPYWERTLSDLNAMVRQLGIPTWFVTLSAADLRWPETIQIIARQYGQEISEDDVIKMNWQERCKWIRCNPVTCATHFDFRFNRFLKDVMLSEAHPIGHIIDFFFRTEFQQRGSPHIHALFWIEGAPMIGSSKEEDVCSFIDQYVSGQLPYQDEELLEIVTAVQKHSHSGTCRKTGKTCRFHFPKPPVRKTMITHPLTQDDIDPVMMKKTKEANAVIMKKVFDTLKDDTDKSLEKLLESAGISEEEYVNALDKSAATTDIILKRHPSETSVNNYNPLLLKIWKANMDIQYVTDPWACAMYILSYISKSERQMGKLLKEASKESKSDDSIRHQMRNVGNVFLSHREVSAQEAVYRLLSIPLKKSSRQTVFVNTSMASHRVHILKPKHLLEQLPAESEDIFQLGILDRYAARPEFMNDLCLADFASSYRMDYDKGELSSEDKDVEDDIGGAVGKKIKLQNNMGSVRRRRQRVIVRTPRFSKTRAPEQYYHSLLMLYLPWRDEQKDLLGGTSTYEQHFEKVKDVVSGNMCQFEKNSAELDEALENFNPLEQPESAWDKLASEEQHQLQEELAEGWSPSDEHQIIDPVELSSHKQITELHCQKVGYTVERQSDKLSNQDYFELVRTLNPEQRYFFDHLLTWCRQTVSSRTKTHQKPPPFHIFLSGGAGTGKSHLIKAVVNMMRRELQPLCDNPEGVTVLLTAPTGVAAANIDGTTIHQALSIQVERGRKATGDSSAISQDKLATMRYLLQNLQVVIVDEISMVGFSMLQKIHGRLKAIMGSTDDELFGGVSILAVGDFYQLKPVLQKPVFGISDDPYSRLNPVHIWRDLFYLYELKTVMRQKGDDEFLMLLNRVRVGQTTEKDLQVIKSRELPSDSTDYPYQALHVFATNADVDSHNLKMLEQLNVKIRHIVAKDITKGVEVDKEKLKPSKTAETGGLRDILMLAVGARVMLTKNLDVDDGLVNGVQGTVVGFIDSDNQTDRQQPVAVLVYFDSKKVGRKLRIKLKKQISDPLPIGVEETRFTLGKYSAVEVVRKQFPLTLAFASTIHKVQGLSLDQMVVTFDSYFQSGQAYVALSRCKTLDGLYVHNFEKSHVKVSKNIEQEMLRLREKPLKMDSNLTLSEWSAKDFTICHLNIQSLPAHFQDLQVDGVLLKSDVIALSETWLHSGKSKDYTLDGYKLVRKDREDTHRCNEIDCKMCNNKGGIAVYVSSCICYQRHPHKEPDNLECVVLSVDVEDSSELYLIILYRPDHLPLTVLQKSLQNIMSKIPVDHKVIVMGDFNINHIKGTVPEAVKQLTDSNLVQVIYRSTYRLGSVIDHAYVPQEYRTAPTAVLSRYYSDHNAVVVSVPVVLRKKDNPCFISKLEEQKHMSDTGTMCDEGTKINCQNMSTVRQDCSSDDVVIVGNKRSFVPSSSQQKLSKSSVEKSSSNYVGKVKKLKRSNSNLKAGAKHKNADVDIECTGEVYEKLAVKEFNPPTQQDKCNIAVKLGLELSNDPIHNPSPRDHNYRALLREINTLNPRTQIDVMGMDGNCFFRAISKETLGTENYHKDIRRLICDFMENHPKTFASWFYLGEQNFLQHLHNMRQDQVWAEELEIIATASFFNTTIWEYTNCFPVGGPWKWIKIQPVACHTDDPPFDGIPLHGCFYIHHTGGVHFDRILPPKSITM